MCKKKHLKTDASALATMKEKTLFSDKEVCDLGTLDSRLCLVEMHDAI